jgi:hypothetical protein
MKLTPYILVIALAAALCGCPANFNGPVIDPNQHITFIFNGVPGMIVVEKGAVSVVVEANVSIPVGVGPFNLTVQGHLMMPAPAGVPASKHLMLYPGASE